MKPTVSWLRRAFALYNKRYFGGKLPTPRFEVTSSCKIGNDDAWGYYDFSAQYNRATRKITRVNDTGVLCLTTKYSRNEEDVIGTLLHEMVHEYIYLVLGIYPVDKHGREFQFIASKIEADGWDLTSNDIKPTDKKGRDASTAQKKTTKILCLIQKPSGTNYKYWCCVCDNENYKQAYLAARSIEGVTNVSFYLCNAKNLQFARMNPSKLTGFGAMTIQELTQDLANWFNENPSVFDFKKLKKL